ncbi:MAG: TIGR04282 family arsenosugar biosynthesis glycosyltransferase [Alphaproteobacteria bacterium]|nr:TIGR04282 family arsenosugar biosynthesis glycosyltransferase [Alphaproteobacteria bacterium]
MRHLILFLRRPQLGRGKRRLAREIGDVAALRFERLMVALLLRRLARDRRWHLRIAATPDRGARSQRGWPSRVPVFGQGRGDLGRRMQRALAACPPGPAVLVGTDLPQLEARHVAAAFGLLGSHDFAFGPALDGGFWLIGARHPPRSPALFKRVRWSGRHTLADTLASLPKKSTTGFAVSLTDVDDRTAWLRLAPRRGF